MTKVAIDKVKDFFQGDRFCLTNGIVIDSIHKDHAVCKVNIDNCHLNAGNQVQGGVIFTLADFAFAVHANSSGKLVVSQSANINYLNSTTSSVLFAYAKLVKMGATTCFYQVDIKDKNDNLIACATISGFILGDNPAFKEDL